VPDDQGMTKRAGKIIEEFKDLVFPAGYEPGKKRVGDLTENLLIWLLKQSHTHSFVL
jgi:hypothetical protein